MKHNRAFAASLLPLSRTRNVQTIVSGLFTRPSYLPSSSFAGSTSTSYFSSSSIVSSSSKSATSTNDVLPLSSLTAISGIDGRYVYTSLIPCESSVAL